MNNETPDKPVIESSAEIQKKPFWSGTKKLVAFLVGAMIFIATLRSCSDKRPTLTARGQQLNLSAPPTADELKQMDDLRKTLEQNQRELSDQLDKVNLGTAPTINDLTAQQQRAAVESAYGSRPGTAGQRQQSGASVSDTKSESKETTAVVSYRGEASALAVASAKPAVPELAPALTAPTPESQSELARAHGTRYRIRQGTLIPCTQMLRINGASTGHINCLVSFPLFSTGGNHLLMPGGTLAIGKVQKIDSQNQERLFVTFDSFIMPDGFTVTVQDAIDGLDQIGQIGLKDKINRHYGQIFGAGLALALVGGLAQIGNNTGSYSASSQYRVGVTESMSQNSMQVLQRFMNVLPTFTIREGARNNIYLAGDLNLPDVQNHDMRGEM